MKSYIYGKIGKIACVVLSVMLVACTNDDGPSIDDHFMNYEIPVIEPKSDIPVGAFYYNMGTNGMDAARYNRLIGEYRPDATPWPQIGPNVRPVLGRYKMNLATSEAVDLFQQHIDWANNAKINFLVLPNIREDINKENRMNQNDVDFVNYMAGYHVNSFEKIKWGDLRFAISITMDNFSDGLSNSKAIEEADVNSEGVSIRCERLYTFVRKLAERFFGNEPLCYEVDGKPMLVIYNGHRLFSKDSELLYRNMRDTIYKYTQKEVYIVARQERWSPPARYHNFFMTGKVDAVYMDNMYDNTDFTRSYMYPQYINENYKYNRE